MKKVLIITNKEDVHTDLVLRELERRYQSVIRFHPDEFPTRMQITYRDEGASVAITDSMKSFEVEEITSVWYRRPLPTVLDRRIGSPSHRKFAADESEHFIENLYALLEHARWVNPFYAGRRARCKLLQIQIGRRFGLIFPKTIVTNDPNEARSFIESCRGDVVYKSVRVGLLHEPDGSSKLIFTTKLGTEDLKRLDQVRLAPCTFQEYVPKQLEIRATVVREQVFACAIHSQDREKTRIDWRHGGAHLEKYSLPDHVVQQLISVTRELGLMYGAFDIILTPDGRYVTLEVNPNGQWAFIEGLAGMPISQALASLLAGE